MITNNVSRKYSVLMPAALLFSMAIAIGAEEPSPSMTLPTGTTTPAVPGKRPLAADSQNPTFTDSEVDCLTVQGLGKFSQADFEGAADEFTKALNLMPKRGTLHLQRGLSYLELNAFEKALADFNEAADLDHANRLALFICKGKAYMGLNKYNDAEKEFDKAIAVDPKAPLAYIGRAENFLLAGEDDKSLADLETALKLDPEQPHAYFLRALYYKKKKQKDHALQDLNKAVELDKSYLTRDGELSKEREKRLESGDDLAELLRLGKHSSRATALIGRGLALERAGNHLAAIKELTDAILASPDSFEAYKWRGCLYLDMSSFEMACKDLTKAIEIMPEDAALFAGRAKAHLEMGDGTQAITDYTKAIELSKTPNAGFYAARGLAYSRTGNSTHAIADFTKAIELDPAIPAPYLNRGLEYMVTKSYSKANDDLTKAIDLHQEKAVAFKFRGQARSHLGDKKGALEDLEKSQALYEAQKDLFGCRQVSRLIGQLKKN